VFREREKAMNEALVAAQQLRQETRASAEREAQAIIREAEVQAGAVKARMAETERQFQAYLGGFRALLERQMAELRALDGQRG